MEVVFADELSCAERDALLKAPYSELRHLVPSGREVIRYHSLSEGQQIWLSKELGYKPWEDELHQVLDTLYWDLPAYTIHFEKKRNGGRRKILAPDRSLKRVQRRILDRILPMYPTFKLAFGFSGGSIFEALVPHLEAGSRSIFSTDIKNAFDSVSFEDVFWTLYGLSIGGSYVKDHKPVYLSREVAYAICRIVTCGMRLPQGAPTSPKLFDMVFLPIDQRLEKLARNVGGVYTRYADNIYFSMPQEEFPGKVARAIIRTIHENRSKRDRYGLMEEERFQCHKICTRPLGAEAIRALGVNLSDGQVRPTRSFKRRIRMSIHRLNWILLNDPYDLEGLTKCWCTLQGQMSFASQGALPQVLQDQYEKARRNYKNLLTTGEVPTTESERCRQLSLFQIDRHHRTL